VPNRSASPFTRARLAGLTLALALTGLAAPAAAADPAPAAETAPVPAPARSADEIEATRAYWTPARVAAAKPAPMPDPAPELAPGGRAAATAPPARGERVAIPSSAPAAAVPQQAVYGEEWPGDQGRQPAISTGRLVYHDPVTGQDFACSASAVNSPNRNLIFTAGHCAYHPWELGEWQEYWHTKWLYIPAYRDGQEPLGRWDVGTAFVPGPWFQGKPERHHYDVAVMAVLPNGAGQELGDVTGGNGLVFNDTPRERPFHAFGYHADSRSPLPANGQRLWHCAGTSVEKPDPVEPARPLYLLPCAMGEGASGGPVLTGFNEHGLGDLISVYAASATLNGRWAAQAPYFDDIVRAVYLAAAPLTLQEVYTPIGQRDGLTTGVRVMNTGTEATVATVRWIREDGTIAKSEETRLDPGGSLTRLQAGPSGFEGSIQVAPRNFGHRLSAATNYIAGNGSVASSPGFAGGAGTVRLPLLMRANAGITTRVVIQNTEPVEANVLFTYYHPDAGEQVVAESLRIPPYGSRIYSQAGAYGHLTSGRPRVFSGTVVASAGKIAATVLEESSRGLSAYGGFTPADASYELAAPLIMHNNNGNWTGVQVQNVEANPARVRLAFGPNTADRIPCGGFERGYETPEIEIRPGASYTFLQNPESVGLFERDCRYVGSARIISSGAKVVAVVNQTGPSGDSAYEAPPAERLTGDVRLPIVQANNSGILTGVQVKNVGGGDARPVLTLEGHDRGAAGACSFGSLTLTPPAPDDVLEPGGSYTWLLWSVPELATCKFVGSGKVTTAAGGQLAVMVNQLLPPSSPVRDKLSTYAGVPQ
jgi:hypothetical protein